jgi:hypothetical protein
MHIRLLSAGLLALATTAALADPQTSQVLEIDASSPGVRTQLGLMFGHIGYDPDTGIATVEADALTRDHLTEAGLTWRVNESASRALQAFIDAGASGGLRSIPGYACYREVEETFDAIDTLVATHPDLASYVDIGVSWRKTQNVDQGYPMRVLRLGNAKTTGTKPILFAMSSVHAREYAPAELMTRFAEQLLAGYGTDADSTWLLDRNEFHLLLQANPDGRKRAEQNVLWRKNENTTHCPQANLNPTGNSHPGVDLNRNFPWGWNGAGGSSGIECQQTYRGPTAASEPETQAIRDYVLSIYPDTRPGSSASLTIPADLGTQGMFLDMHSYGDLLLWPWGMTDAVTGNMAAFERLGRRLAWFNEHQPQQSIELYPTDGTTVDFAYGELGLPAFTYEMGTQFFQDCTSFESTILPRNLASLRYAARALHAPYLLPAGPDAYDSDASSATVVRGGTVTITVTVSDNRYRLASSSTPAHAIAGARVFVDQLPWDPGATGIDMAAADGTFNMTTEQARLIFDTSDLEPGRHLLFIQGRDSADERGPPTAIFLVVEPNDDVIFAHDFEMPAFVAGN